MDISAETWKAKARKLRDVVSDLRFLNREGMLQYDIQQKRACEAEAQIARLREALEDIQDRLHQLDVALGMDAHLAKEVFVHLGQRVTAAIREGMED